MIKPENICNLIDKGDKIYIIHRTGKNNEWINFITARIKEVVRETNYYVHIEEYKAYMPDKDKIYDQASFPGAYLGFNLASGEEEVTKRYKEHERLIKPIARKICGELTDTFKEYLEISRTLFG